MPQKVVFQVGLAPGSVGFIGTRPDLWLMQIESIFRLADITDERDKYDLIFSHLPEALIVKHSQILQIPYRPGHLKLLTDALKAR